MPPGTNLEPPLPHGQRDVIEPRFCADFSRTRCDEVEVEGRYEPMLSMRAATTAPGRRLPRRRSTFVNLFVTSVNETTAISTGDEHELYDLSRPTVRRIKPGIALVSMAAHDTLHYSTEIKKKLVILLRLGGAGLTAVVLYEHGGQVATKTASSSRSTILILIILTTHSPVLFTPGLFSLCVSLTCRI